MAAPSYLCQWKGLVKYKCQSCRQASQDTNTPCLSKKHETTFFCSGKSSETRFPAASAAWAAHLFNNNYYCSGGFHTMCWNVTISYAAIWLARTVQCVLHNFGICVSPDPSTQMRRGGPARLVEPYRLTLLRHHWHCCICSYSHNIISSGFPPVFLECTSNIYTQTWSA